VKRSQTQTDFHLNAQHNPSDRWISHHKYTAKLNTLFTHILPTSRSLYKINEKVTNVQAHSRHCRNKILLKSVNKIQMGLQRAQCKTCKSSKSGVGKVRPTGQIRPASSVHPARGGLSVLTLNSARKTYRTMSDCFHAERDLVAH